MSVRPHRAQAARAGPLAERGGLLWSTPLGAKLCSPGTPDSESSDPALKALAPPVHPAHGLGPDAVDASWFSRREKAAQVLPRVESYPFDPYTQSRPELYIFRRDQVEPRIYFTQVRADEARLGQLETTATGAPRTSVMKIKWHKFSGGVYDWKMIGEGYPEGQTIAEGYCKQTDLGGTLRWVIVATRLHNRDLPATQGERLFSLTLYEAIATGVAYGLWEDDTKIKLTYPELGGLGIGATADVGSSFSADATIQGKGPQRWVDTDAADANRMVEADATFTPVPSKDGSANKWSMEVKCNDGVPGIGAIFPIRNEVVDVARDGQVIDRLVIHETPVKFNEDPTLTGISRYEVEVFATARSAVPTATIEVSPVALKGARGLLEFKKHITKPKVGAQWIVPGKETIIVGKDDVSRAMEETPGWDPRLHATIEASMLKLRTQHSEMVAEAGIVAPVS